MFLSCNGYIIIGLWRHHEVHLVVRSGHKESRCARVASVGALEMWTELSVWLFGLSFKTQTAKADWGWLVVDSGEGHESLAGCRVPGGGTLLPSFHQAFPWWRSSCHDMWRARAW